MKWQKSKIVHPSAAYTDSLSHTNMTLRGGLIYLTVRIRYKLDVKRRVATVDCKHLYSPDGGAVSFELKDDNSFLACL